MVRALRYAIVLSATYIVAWTVSYIFVFLSRGEGLDFRYYVEYFLLAWTFRGFELPSFIWLSSLVAFAPLAVVSIVLMRRWARSRGLLYRNPSGEITPTI